MVSWDVLVKRRIPFLPIVVVLGSLGCPSESGTARLATPAREGLTATDTFRISDGDRCPVCAMPIAKHVDTAAAVELVHGRTFYFCGNGCALRSWLDPKEHLGCGPEQRRRLMVRDYYSGKPVDAAGQLFVVGSDVMGPMGPMPVAVSPPQRKVFVERHGGTETFRLSEIDAARFAEILKRAKGTK